MSKTPYIFYTMDNIDGIDLIDEQGHLNGVLDGAVQIDIGYIYKALDFDGSSKVTCGPHPGLTDNMAISFFCKFDTLGADSAYYDLIVVSNGSLNTGISLIRTHDAARIHMAKSNSSSDGAFQVFAYNNASYGHTPDMGTWYHYFCQYNNNTSEYEFWVDGSSIFTTSPSIFGSGQSGYNGITMGNDLDCKIDHVKIFDLSSSGPLSESEIQALRDEEEFCGCFSGYTKVNGVGTGPRVVYAYRSDTGDLVGSTTSSGNGYFYLTTTYSGSHFVVALDDAEGLTYNDKIYGRVIPVPTTVS